MKNLKFKIGLFSLLAIFAVSVFTSCEQSEIIEPLEEQVSNKQDDALLLMPHGFETLSEEEKTAYFDKLTDVDYAKLTENHRVGSYLRSIKKYGELYDRMETGQLILDIDLGNVLTAEEVITLSNYQYDNIELRNNCLGWKDVSYTTPWGEKRCMWKRSCTPAWYIIVSTSWTEYSYQCNKPG